ncbi:MAG: hypothetical protein KDK25_01250 [Leptospiraceae bacterium]|nr:hypothetical protein [Leptospiraceae bacterium]
MQKNKLKTLILSGLCFLSGGALRAEESAILIEILGGVGQGSGPAVEQYNSSDYQFYLLDDYFNTTNPEIQQIQIYQYLQGFEPEVSTSSQRFSIMGQPGDYLELGTSLQISNFKAKNLYPRYLSPPLPQPIPFYSPSWNQSPFRELARTDLNSALYLYSLRDEQNLDPAFFLSLDIRLVLPMGPAALYVTGSLPVGEDSGNGRAAFALGFRLKVAPALSLYAEAHRGYMKVNWDDRNSRSISDIAYDTGMRFGIGIGGAH